MQVVQLSHYERNQSPLGAFRRDTHKGFPSHSHDFTELVVVLAGEGRQDAPVDADIVEPADKAGALP